MKPEEIRAAWIALAVALGVPLFAAIIHLFNLP
jgi:hypothetical protein